MNKKQEEIEIGKFMCGTHCRSFLFEKIHLGDGGHSGGHGSRQPGRPARRDGDVRHRLGQGSPLRGDPLGHGLEKWLREKHVLCEAAGSLRTIAHHRRRFAQQSGDRADQSTGSNSLLGLRPVVDDLGAELVSEDDRIERFAIKRTTLLPTGRHEIFGVANRVKIGAADATGDRFDEHLARTRFGIANLFERELPAFHHDCAHWMASRSG